MLPRVSVFERSSGRILARRRVGHDAEKGARRKEEYGVRHKKARGEKKTITAAPPPSRFRRFFASSSSASTSGAASRRGRSTATRSGTRGHISSAKPPRGHHPNRSRTQANRRSPPRCSLIAWERLRLAPDDVFEALRFCCVDASRPRTSGRSIKVVADLI